MRRGDVFTVSLRGLASKPRPAVVLHADEFILPERPVIFGPLSSELADASLIRITIEPSAENGLHVVSQLMADRLSGANPREIGRRIARLSDEDIVRVEFALVTILGLAHARTVLSAIGTTS